MLFKCLYVVYVFVVLFILLFGFFVVLYSMEWGKVKFEEWLKMFFMFFLELLFIVDFIKVCFDDFFVFFYINVKRVVRLCLIFII